MELKPLYARGGAKQAGTSNCTNMELKHHYHLITNFIIISSNCTNMELKLEKELSEEESRILLIAPIWN